MPTEILESQAQKVIEVVDVGLCAGVGDPVPGEMCVEAAVCFALGLPHGDDPPCVSRSLRRLKIVLNDASWSSKAARSKVLRRLSILQLGSDGIDEVDFARRIYSMVRERIVPRAEKYAEWAAMAAQSAELI